jgi:hypothetical protein
LTPITKLLLPEFKTAPLLVRPTNVNGEIENPEIGVPPIPMIMEETFKNRDRLPPPPFFDPDQVGNLPEVPFLFFYSFVKSPEEIG